MQASQGGWVLGLKEKERARWEEAAYIDTGTEANASSVRGTDNTFA